MLPTLPVQSATADDRQVTAIDALAERWLDTEVRLDPVLGTKLGREGSARTFGDYSPEGIGAGNAAARGVLSELTQLAPQDAVDEVTVRELTERLTLRLDRAAAGLELRDLTVLETPAQLIRQAFDLMPRESEADWHAVASRLAAVPRALAGYRETLRLGAAPGTTPARRQLLAVASQAERFAADYFPALAGAAELREPLARDLGRGAQLASAAYAELASFLRDELAPIATTQDAVGREHYALASREFLGSEIDLDECYEWGVSELARIDAEQRRTAREISPGGSVAEAVAILDADPDRLIHGEAALQRWLQERSDEAITALAGRVFTIPDALRRLECRIAPTREGGIYYTSPSEDFARPGRMWWTVPAGVTEFRKWRELTTVYHEGVPGHHLQLGGAVAMRGTLNAWRRTRAGTSGHLEGWALYAERLMEELGFLEDPAARLGMLDAQRLRAARVVVDIGVHLGKRMPSGERFTASGALAFMIDNVTMREEALRFEVLRYLGWPGQAISYKVGERAWLELREDAERHSGFDLRAFHSAALSMGTLGLDTLRWAMRR